MSNPERPPLTPADDEAVEVEQYEIQAAYSQQVREMRLVLFSLPILYLGDRPPPKQPERLCSILSSYSCALFDAEAKRYPHELELPRWLTSLARRIEEMAMQWINEVDAGYRLKFTDHATRDQMRRAIRTALQVHVKTYVEKPKFIATPAATQRLTAAEPKAPPKGRLRGTITSPIGARRMEAFIEATGKGQTEFAITAGTTDRTLRNFRKKGTVRRDIFDGIAEAMGITRDELMKPEG